MFINDIRADFHNYLCRHKSRVLLLVAQDVDALCACRILQTIFQCENILYTLVPIAGKSHLEESFKLHGEHVKHVVMVNCGATIDIVSVLQPKDDVVFFIADSHRPIHVNNVYNDSQVRLVMKQSDEDSIPAFEDLYREEESDDEDVIDDALVERRQERRQWEEKRTKILFDYTQFSYYNLSSAVQIFELAWKLSKDSIDILWWAIIGLTEQYLHGRLEQNQYLLEVGNLQGHVSRHSHQNIDDVHMVSADCLRVTFDKELQLNMYRHWSLFESLKHTMYTACQLKLWTQKGQKKLYEFLAEMGLPLNQCRQKYSCMDIQLKSNVKVWMEELANKYGLNQIVYGSFVAQYGYRHKFCAMDLVRACSAILESTNRDKSPADRFHSALKCLSRKNVYILERGLEEAKFQLTAIFKQVQSLLDMHGIISAGPFLYAVIQEGTPDACYFSYPACLFELARFLLNAHVNVSKSKKSRNLPLVLMAPMHSRPEFSIVVGIPPVSEDSPRNFFGKAFEQAALRVRSVVIQDHFDLSFVQILSEEKSKFFDALVTLLT